MTPSAVPNGAIQRVGIVGCGLMGSGIAQLCAGAGLDVRIAVRTPTAIPARRRELCAAFDRAVRKRHMTGAARDRALERIDFTTELTDLADRQLVIESITEQKSAKAELFAALDKILQDPEAVLASNTSSVSITSLAAVTDRPSHVLGMHFFSPAPVIPLVELTPSLHTEPAVTAHAETFVTTVLGKKALHTPDRAGFLVNSLLVPYLVSAIRMLESGQASAAVIDQAMVHGCSHPVGPLKLADLIGLDIIASVATALYEEFKQPLYAPPPLLVRMVEGGLLGKKTGRGFHVYEQ
ncbi:3-hydroxybutyryl-CoA dehydrogenase [Streptomyces purpurogeneiscleroticus]|uniref:3-hydroxybutyryl-CoA dehydrogenase n=1 Tax=Streptomyces purpurogeneiscleroticus TaxID=68259 RepID=UPI001CBAD645|nr:3-hydroxybutyryl-CoA dehydrogenase [Streptomyces purpurogeneiscleroticus]MBZ4016058.1 3-hydroxybutyryl-CoA dehydrogenase [Streptomyces purpurogeneiscleroticus]